MKSISQPNAVRRFGCALGLGIVVLLAGCSSSAKPAGEAEAQLLVPELQERLKSTEPATRLGAVQGLRRHGKDAAPAVADLLRVLKEDPELSVRQAAALALGEVGPSAVSAVAELVRILQQETDAPFRRQAALALGKIGPAAKAALPVLRRAATEGPPIVRTAASEAVKSIESAR